VAGAKTGLRRNGTMHVMKSLASSRVIITMAAVSQLLSAASTSVSKKSSDKHEHNIKLSVCVAGC